MMISIVSPVYKAKNLIPILVERIELALTGLSIEYEIILVDDGCPENSWSAVQKACLRNPKVKGIKLSRNFGQHHAITAGLDNSQGDWVVVMDCDLQDQPEEIPKLLKEAISGYDIVLARRSNRQDHFLKRLYSKTFYRTLGYLTGSEQDETIANFGIYHRRVINEVIRLKESIRYFPTMVKWVGFKTSKIDVEHAQREDGKSTYNMKRMLNLALDIILAYSDKPLRLTIKLGVLISGVSIMMSIYTLIKWFFGGITVVGYSSLITSIWFLSGCLLITLGVVGMYVGKTFEGVKNRPIYIIEDALNDQ